MNRYSKLVCCGSAVCLTLASGISSGQNVSFRESGHPRTEYPVGSFPRNAIGTGDFNNNGLPDVASGSNGAVSVLLAAADGSGFGAAGSFAVNGTVVSLAIGDVNGDGNLDIITAAPFTSNPVSLLRGNGDGSFQAATSLPFSFSSPEFVALVDLNADQKLDLVVTSDSGILYVLLGNGDGTFQNPRTISLPGNGGSIASGDFDGDGRLDLVIAVSGSLLLLLGNGDGSFQSPRTVASGAPARIAVAGDFNGDKRLDLAVLQPNSVAIVLGNGNGTFQAPRLTAIANDSSDIKAGDLNSDGALDVVVSHCPFSGTSFVGILFGNGNGALQAPVATYTFGCTAGVALADFDLDGSLDVAANKNAPNGTVMLLPGNGDGTIGPRRPPTGNNPNSIAAGDFNEDGIADLVVSNGSSNNVSLFLGNGDTTFQPARNLPVGLGPSSVAVGDINADGHLDLAVANINSDDVSVLRGRGDGTFIPLGAVLVGDRPLAVVFGDFNRDGNLDMAVVRSFGQLSVLLGNGDGTFQVPISSSSGASSPTSLARADLNGDEIDDLVVTDGSSFSGSVVVLLGVGNGTFQAPRRFNTDRSPSSVAVGDLNGDGIPDLAVSNRDTQNVTVLLGIGNGMFQAGVDFFVLGTSPAAVVLGDFNADGRLDIATANSFTNNVSILLNNEVSKAAVLGPVSFVDVGEFGAGSFPRAMVVGDFNADGLPDLAVANSLSNDLTVLFNASR